MYDKTSLKQLLKDWPSGSTLPQPFYLDADIFHFDLDAIFYRNWIMVGFESELSRPGAFLATSIGPTPIVVLRDRQDQIVGFHNSCRHRGAQICKTGTGRVVRLVCPYHQWTYTLDGKLASARDAAPSFDMSRHNLLPIKVEAIGGCIYVSLSDQAPDIAPLRQALEPALKPYNLSQLKVAHSVDLLECANWKLVMENARECHHCNARHPEFMTALPVELVESGKPFPEGEEATPFMMRMKELGFVTEGELAEWWQIGRIRLRDGWVTFSTDGKPLVKKLLCEANGGDLGTFRWASEPNSFCHVTSDSLFTFSVNPTGPVSTTVTARWLVHKDAVEGIDYQVDNLIHMWNETNLQDRELAENNQLGVNGIGYRPGSYSPTGEPYIIRFMDWYCAQARAFLERTGRHCSPS